MTDPNWFASEIDFSADGPCEPGTPEWQRRFDAFMNDPAPWSWWWLSFVDPELPEGSQFLGVCVVPANNVVMAAQAARWLGCNPGGEVAGCPALPEGWVPRSWYVGRLFPGAEGRAFAAQEIETWAEPV